MTAKIPEVLPGRRSADPSAAAARREARAARRQQSRIIEAELLRTALQQPLVIGMGAMLLNEVAYRAGLYNPRPGESNQSILGGPVWFQVGPALPPAQAKRNFINAFIIGVTTAQAMGPGIAAGLRTMADVGKAVA